MDLKYPCRIQTRVSQETYDKVMRAVFASGMTQHDWLRAALDYCATPAPPPAPQRNTPPAYKQTETPQILPTAPKHSPDGLFTQLENGNWYNTAERYMLTDAEYKRKYGG